MQGILLVDKPADWTSFDVVSYVRMQLAQASGVKPKNLKVGHSGTLDPFATGLLILLVGKEYTRRAGEFTKLTKVYEAEMKLGYTSSTGDPEGDIENYSQFKPSLDEVKQALAQFKGDINQTPPAYSAIKIDGQRAYKLARRGEKVEIPSRRVTIKDIELINYDYPLVTFRANVSSGTYIRSLVEDIGKSLGAGAYTSKLRRLSVGNYFVEHSIKLPTTITKVNLKG